MHSVILKFFRSWRIAFVLGFLGMLLASPVALVEAKKDDLQNLENKNATLEARRRAIQQKKNEKLRAANKMTSQIVQNQHKLYRAQNDLYYQQNRLIQTRDQLNILGHEIDRTIGETTRLTGDASKRMRQLYTGGRVNMLQMILDAEDISTFLDRIYYKQKLVAQDKRVLRQLRHKTVQLRRQKEELARQQIYIDETIRNIEGLRSTISSRLVEDKKLRERYWNDAKYYEQAEKELLRESSRIQAEIMRLTGGGKESIVSSTGAFAWPVIGRITSGFGYRRHPIHRKSLMHTGLDIAKNHGAPVQAADGGQVIFSGWRGGYGKVVMINHGTRNGKNLVSLYGHLSSYSVGKGQTVRKGQVIANVGTTGYSTGPHLHFEIREDGSPVDPKRYLH